MSGDDDIVDIFFSLRLFTFRRITLLRRHLARDLASEAPRKRLGEGLVGSAGSDTVIEKTRLGRGGRAHFVDVEAELVDRLLEDELQVGRVSFEAKRNRKGVRTFSCF